MLIAPKTANTNLPPLSVLRLQILALLVDQNFFLCSLCLWMFAQLICNLNPTPPTKRIVPSSLLVVVVYSNFSATTTIEKTN